MAEFCRLVSDETGSSVIYSKELDTATVTGEWNDRPVPEVMRDVARALSTSVREHGSVYFFGQAKPEDRAHLVTRIRRMEKAAIQEAIALFQGGQGRAAVHNDGLVIVVDTVEVLEQMATAFALVENQDSAVWIVQLTLVGWSREAAQEFGVDVEPAARVAVGAAMSANGLTPTITGTASLDAILRLANNRDDVAVVASPMLCINDGEAAQFVQGDKVPYQTTTIDADTNVSTISYQMIQTGLTVDVKLREQSKSSARLDLQVKLSDIKAAPADRPPTTGEESLQTISIVEAGGVYLLGSMARERRSQADAIGWQTGQYEKLNSQVVQVWCEAFRVGGPVRPGDSGAYRNSDTKALNPPPSGQREASPAAMSGNKNSSPEASKLGPNTAGETRAGLNPNSELQEFQGPDVVGPSNAVPLLPGTPVENDWQPVGE